MAFQPTAEQQACVDSYATGKSFKVEACAGSGKSRSIQLMAESDEMKSCLYLAFNKAAATEASGKMPAHATCRTTHSMAYAAFGGTYRNKLSRPRNGYVNMAGTVGEIARYFKVSNTGSLNKMGISRLAKLAVASFESSAKDKITEGFISQRELEILAKKAEMKGNIFDKQSVMNAVMKVAKQLWEARLDLNSPVLITHDTYLKMYQLSKPTLRYDVIFLDEAQDTTDCVIDIVMSQTDHAQVVAVGDSYQNIYGFRNAVNALAKLGMSGNTLSQSFRYGPEVAKVATAILDGAMDVKGFDKVPTVVGAVDKEKPYTHLFRTNSALIEEGIYLLESGVNVKMDVDISGYVKLLEAAAALYYGDTKLSKKHPDLCVFDTWDDLMEEAELIKGELMRVARKVSSRKHISTLKVLKGYTKPWDADVTLTTAHKSKGMEYAQVILANDFPGVIDEDGDYRPLNDMERNLAYVAATRAQEVLELNQTVEDIMANYDVDGEKVEVEFKKVMKGNLRELTDDVPF